MKQKMLYVVTLAAILLLFVLGSMKAANVRFFTFASPLSLPERYCAGGGGNYQVDIPCWRDWDASYNYPPGQGGRPAWKMWTVGKFNNRPDATCVPGGYIEPTRANIDLIFACESSKIAALIQSGYAGNSWEIGNEPNWWPSISPSDYAYQFSLYHDFIEARDPTAKILNGGVKGCLELGRVDKRYHRPGCRA